MVDDSDGVVCSGLDHADSQGLNKTNQRLRWACLYKCVLEKCPHNLPVYGYIGHLHAQQHVFRVDFISRFLFTELWCLMADI
jgi:hypothetical protein